MMGGVANNTFQPNNKHSDDFIIVMFRGTSRIRKAQLRLSLSMFFYKTAYLVRIIYKFSYNFLNFTQS